MSVESKRRLLLKNLMNTRPPSSHGLPSDHILLSIRSDMTPLLVSRPKTSTNGAAMPYQRRVNKAIGHIYSLNTGLNSLLHPETKQISTTPVPKFSHHKVVLRYRSSTVSPGGPFSSADLLNYNGYGAETGRFSSGDTRNSSSPDDNGSKMTRKGESQKVSSRSKNRPNTNGRPETVDELPAVDENSNNNVRTNPALVKVKGQRTGGFRSLNGMNRNEISSPTNHPHHISPLSISGLSKPDSANKSDASSPSNPDITEGSTWSTPPITNSNRIPTVTKPPTITSLQTNSASSVTSNGPQTARRIFNKSSSPSVTSNGNAGNTKMLQYKSKPEPEPKYPDPVMGSTPSFQARLSELASLEAETVRWERLRKLKKKPRERDD